MSPWTVLGIEPTADERVIKRAYATLLKQTRPDSDKDGFIRLREAYERALVLKDWVGNEDDEWDEDDDGDDLAVRSDVPASEQVASVAPDPLVQPIRLHWQQESGQSGPSPLGQPSAELLFAHLDPLPPTEPPVSPPVRTAADYQRGWQMDASTETTLLARIRADLAEDALLHIERRADYEHAFLVWLLKQNRTYPDVFLIALDEFNWNEKRTLWGGWPWDQLDDYRLRCQLDAFFAHPAAYQKDWPLLSQWLVNRAAGGGRLLRLARSMPFNRGGLRRELARFDKQFRKTLNGQPTNKPLEELRAQLDAPVIKPFWSTIFAAIMCGLLIIFSKYFSELGTLLAGIMGLLLSTLLVFKVCIQLYRSLASGLQHILEPPPWILVHGLLLLSALIGLPALAMQRLQPSPDLGNSPAGYLDLATSLIIIASAMVYARLSDLLARNVIPSLQRMLSPSPAVRAILIVSGIILPIGLVFIEPPPVMQEPLFAKCLALGLILPASLWLTATHLVKQFGPRISRRNQAYLVLTALSIGLSTASLTLGHGIYVTQLFTWLLLIPLLSLTPPVHDPRLTRPKPDTKSLFCTAVVVLAILCHGLLAYLEFHDDGHITGLALCLSIFWVVFYNISSSVHD